MCDSDHDVTLTLTLSSEKKNKQETLNEKTQVQALHL